jgi:hypothetical protein
MHVRGRSTGSQQPRLHDRILQQGRDGLRACTRSAVVIIHTFRRRFGGKQKTIADRGAIIPCVPFFWP